MKNYSNSVNKSKKLLKILSDLKGENANFKSQLTETFLENKRLRELQSKPSEEQTRIQTLHFLFAARAKSSI